MKYNMVYDVVKQLKHDVLPLATAFESLLRAAVAEFSELSRPTLPGLFILGATATLVMVCA
jgi:hypothetical protein